ncbi:MAG: class I SAM-dependent methyltransferase [Betaproteobacteria bacterium]|nr:class I SAM-dependent methyltransferase [Betaproteobacteria bacterium]
MNPDVVKQFGGKLLNIYTGAVLTKLIEIGFQVGLFEGSRAGPATTDELADRLGLKERYVREWLGAMATSGIYSYDPASKRYSLPQEHAALLTGNSAQNLSPMSRMINHFGTHLPKLTACFRQGGGIPYSAYRPVFTQCMDDMWRRIFDQLLVSGFIGVVDGLTDRLRQGIRVLDIGCGTGHAMNVLAREYPKSTFLGYDIAEDAIARARAEAKEMGLTNATFEVVDVTDLPGDPTFQLITAFDAIHDQKAPDSVLRSAQRALAPGGTFLMIEFKFSSRIEENVANPFAPMYYGISLMHCMPVSLAVGGQGLGTVWGEQTARRMLGEAGFGNVSVLDTPRPQNCMFVATH